MFTKTTQSEDYKVVAPAEARDRLAKADRIIQSDSPFWKMSPDERLEVIRTLHIDAE